MAAVFLQRGNFVQTALARLLAGLAVVLAFFAALAAPARAGETLERIRLSEDGGSFVREGSGDPFVVWGLNYDHDRSGRLIEGLWEEQWETVAGDFREMKALGANTVRIHLQAGRFLISQDQPNREALERLGRLVSLAEKTGLYLNVTGLGCYHKKETPAWYDALDEADRWDAQACFWEAVAEVCAKSPAIFCYDLMNEPVLDGGAKNKGEWLVGEFGGKNFVQRITLDLAGRDGKTVAKAWVDKLVAAIRKNDQRHLITVGVIPWAHVWPTAKPLFYGPKVGANLDFVSVHFYPQKDKVAKALAALKVYDIGKPLVVEEMFPLKCELSELGEFIDGSKDFAEGWTGFYWGKTIDEHGDEPLDLADAVKKSWLEFFSARAAEMARS